MQYPLTFNTWGPEEVDAITRTLQEGRYTMGPAVKRFESLFAAKFGVKYAVMVNSGSSANLIATAALSYKRHRPLERGDEVIVPAISWATTYYPLSQYGLTLRFVDVDLNTLNIDAAKIESAITPKTRMIVAVSILGNPAPLGQLREICNRRGLYLFEDNCESMGASLNGRAAGTFGDLNTFSLFFSHHISTMEGGMILTDDRELADLCISLRAHGWTRDLPGDTALYSRRSDDFFEAYRFILPGYNVRPLEISAAAGCEQLIKLDRMVEIRRENARHFQALFSGDKRFIIQRENGESSWFSFTVILDKKLDTVRKRVLDALHAGGIEFRIITGGNFLRHDVIRHIPHTVFEGTPNADLAHDRGFFVGNAPVDLRQEIDHFRRIIDKAAA